MRAFFKWTGIVLVLLVVAFVSFVFAKAGQTYEAPYPEIVTTSDSAVVARGKHLVYGPAHCADCHAPLESHARLNAGEEVDFTGGIPFELPIGTVYPANITPDAETGIGRFTDAELARSLRYGVRHDGRPIIDLMPFYDVSEADMTAILSYLRSTAPVRSEVPENEWNFLGKAIHAFGLIKPMGDGDVPAAPPVDSTAAYGEYLARSVANCRGCHTNRDLMTGAYVGPEFAGGFGEQVPVEGGGMKFVVSANLTPDPETGRMVGWSEADFIARFRAGRIVKESFMPWESFSRMDTLELKALYRFFQTLDPVKADPPIPKELVDTWPPEAE